MNINGMVPLSDVLDYLRNRNMCVDGASGGGPAETSSLPFETPGSEY